MKAIKVLLVLQTAMLVVLFYKVVVEEDQAIERPVQVADPPDPIVLQPEDQPVITPRGEMVLDEKKLRRIIRSELKVHSDLLAEAEKDSEKQEPEIDPVENILRLDVVKQEMTYYIKRGEISDTEMHKLQSEISQLDSESRKLMMGELVRALNSGELTGRL